MPAASGIRCHHSIVHCKEVPLTPPTTPIGFAEGGSGALSSCPYFILGHDVS